LTTFVVAYSKLPIINNNSMIQIIQDIPQNVAAFRASGEVTKNDYQNVLMPEVDRLVKERDELNFLLQLDTDVENFTAGAWMQDALVGLKNITKWHRAAIVTDSERVISVTNAFSYLVPGEFKGFKKAAYEEAVSWVSGNA
jgi:stage II sporulation SpoAA-like protein